MSLKEVGDPSNIKDASSAYRDSLNSLFPILMPFMFLLLRILIASTSAHNMKIYGDKESPCLHPLHIGKKGERLSSWLTTKFAFLKTKLTYCV